MTVSLCGNNVAVLRVSARCYWMIQKPLNFTDAQRRCQDEGGILAEIPDKDAQEAINESVKFRILAEIMDLDSLTKIE